jgi:hypothetical protein
VTDGDPTTLINRKVALSFEGVASPEVWPTGHQNDQLDSTGTN